MRRGLIGWGLCLSSGAGRGVLAPVHATRSVWAGALHWPPLTPAPSMLCCREGAVSAIPGGQKNGRAARAARLPPPPPALPLLPHTYAPPAAAASAAAASTSLSVLRSPLARATSAGVWPAALVIM